MWPFNREPKKTIAPSVAAATLDLHAHMDIPAEDFPSLEESVIGRLNTMLYFTRAAIIIQWLRLVIATSRDAKWRAILDSFEVLTFPLDPIEGVEVVRYVQDLIALTTRSQAFTAKTDVTNAQLHTEMRLWWEEWLMPVSANDLIVEEIGHKYGLLLLLHIIDETKALGELVSSTGADTVAA
jgi:hypothetical protein